MSEGHGSPGKDREPWSTDADAWRGQANQDVPKTPSERHWPQLLAGPLYWMWLELFERERGTSA
jgi:hypothetical protein